MPPGVAKRSSKAAARGSIESAVGSIRRLIRVLRLAAQRTQAAAGVSAAKVFVLEQLADGSRLSLKELASRTLTDRSSVAEVVDRLEKQKLVNRETDPADRRRAAVRITPAGRRLLARSPLAPTSALIAALRRLEPREREALAQSLIRLNAALGASDAPAPLLFVDDAGVKRRSRARAFGRSRD